MCGELECQHETRKQVPCILGVVSLHAQSCSGMRTAKNNTFWKRVPNLVFFSPSVRLSSLSGPGGMTSAMGANDTIAGDVRPAPHKARVGFVAKECPENLVM